MARSVLLSRVHGFGILVVLSTATSMPIRDGDSYYFDASAEPLIQSTEHWSKQIYNSNTNGNSDIRLRNSIPGVSLGHMPLRVHFELVDIPIYLQHTLELTVLPQVKDQIQDYLKVVPVKGNLVLSDADLCAEYWPQSGSEAPKCKSLRSSISKSCAVPHAHIPEHHFSYDVYNQSSGQWCEPRNGAGIPNADIVIYMTVNSQYCSGSDVLAYASTCYRDQNDRPIAGVINICSRGADLVNDLTQINTTVKLLLHELTHVLGFSRTSMAYFRNCEMGSIQVYENDTFSCPPRVPRASDGQPIVESDGSIPGVLEQGPSGVLGIITPTAVAHGKVYFGCDSLENVPLEDEGNGGISSQHWEHRFMAYDLMNPYISVGFGHKYLLSDITLGVLLDSGWYALPDVRTDLHTHEWGKGHGCSIFSCSDSNGPNSKSADTCTVCTEPTFCNVENELGCSHDYLDKAVCATVSSFNGCSSFLPQTNGRCNNPSIAPFETGLLETFGENSRCFLNTDPRSESLCFQHHCSVGQLKVRVGPGTWHHCRHLNEKIEAETEAFICTAPETFCNTSLARTTRDIVKVQFSSPIFTVNNYQNVDVDDISAQMEIYMSTELNIPRSYVFVTNVNVGLSILILSFELIAYPDNSPQTLRTLKLAAEQLISEGKVRLTVQNVSLEGKPYEGDQSEGLATSLKIAILVGSFAVVTMVIVIFIRRRRLAAGQSILSLLSLKDEDSTVKDAHISSTNVIGIQTRRECWDTNTFSQNPVSPEPVCAVENQMPGSLDTDVASTSDVPGAIEVPGYYEDYAEDIGVDISHKMKVSTTML